MTEVKACVIPGCGSAHRARGWCIAHYQIWLRSGSPQQKVLPLPELVRLRRAVGLPDEGPTEDQRKRWHAQEMQGL